MASVTKANAAASENQPSYRVRKVCPLEALVEVVYDENLGEYQYRDFEGSNTKKSTANSNETKTNIPVDLQNNNFEDAFFMAPGGANISVGLYRRCDCPLPEDDEHEEVHTESSSSHSGFELCPLQTQTCAVLEARTTGNTNANFHTNPPPRLVRCYDLAKGANLVRNVWPIFWMWLAVIGLAMAINAKGKHALHHTFICVVELLLCSCCWCCCGGRFGECCRLCCFEDSDDSNREGETFGERYNALLVDRMLRTEARERNLRQSRWETLRARRDVEFGDFSVRGRSETRAGATTASVAVRQQEQPPPPPRRIPPPPPPSRSRRPRQSTTTTTTSGMAPTSWTRADSNRQNHQRGQQYFAGLDMTIANYLSSINNSNNNADGSDNNNTANREISAIAEASPVAGIANAIEAAPATTATTRAITATNTTTPGEMLRSRAVRGLVLRTKLFRRAEHCQPCPTPAAATTTGGSGSPKLPTSLSPRQQRPGHHRQRMSKRPTSNFRRIVYVDPDPPQNRGSDSDDSDSDDSSSDSGRGAAAIAVVAEDTHSEDDDEPMCIICFGPFREGDRIGDLPHCNHLFHATCLKTWITHKNKCPVCQQAIAEAFSVP